MSAHGRFLYTSIFLLLCPLISTHETLRIRMMCTFTLLTRILWPCKLARKIGFVPKVQYKPVRDNKRKPRIYSTIWNRATSDWLTDWLTVHHLKLDTRLCYSYAVQLPYDPLMHRCDKIISIAFLMGQTSVSDIKPRSHQPISTDARLFSKRKECTLFLSWNPEQLLVCSWIKVWKKLVERLHDKR